jgi:hypothetical protein
MSEMKVGNLAAAFENVHELAEELIVLLQKLEKGGAA